METISPNVPAHPVMSWPRECDCYSTRFLSIWISYLSVILLSPPKLRRQQESTVSGSNSQWDELKDVVLQQQPHSTPALTCLNISHRHADTACRKHSSFQRYSNACATSVTHKPVICPDWFHSCFSLGGAYVRHETKLELRMLLMRVCVNKQLAAKL